MIAFRHQAWSRVGTPRNHQLHLWSLDLYTSSSLMCLSLSAFCMNRLAGALGHLGMLIFCNLFQWRILWWVLGTPGSFRQSKVFELLCKRQVRRFYRLYPMLSDILGNCCMNHLSLAFEKGCRHHPRRFCHFPISLYIEGIPYKCHQVGELPGYCKSLKRTWTDLLMLLCSRCIAGRCRRGWSSLDQCRYQHHNFCLRIKTWWMAYIFDNCHQGAESWARHKSARCTLYRFHQPWSKLGNRDRCHLRGASVSDYIWSIYICCLSILLSLCMGHSPGTSSLPASSACHRNQLSHHI